MKCQSRGARGLRGGRARRWLPLAAGVILALAMISRADPPPPDASSTSAGPAPDASALPDTTPTTDNVQPVTVPNTAQGTDANSTNSQNPNNSTDQNSDNTANNPPAPNVPGPGDTTNPNSPLLPIQGVNTSPLYISPLANGGEPAQLSAPALYNTGAFDLSQISANNALAEAFMQTGVVSSEQTPDQGPGPLDRIRIGPVDLKTNLNFSVVSDDNINASSGGPNKYGDIEFNLTPAILFVYGDHEGQTGYASVVYAPTLVRYYHHSANDADNQNVAANFQYPLQRLTLNATETYTQVTGVNTDARARTTQTTNVATIGGNYEIDDKLSVQSHLEQLDTDYSNGSGGNSSGAGGGSSDNNFNGLQGESRTSIDSNASYHLTDKLTLGPGANFGIEKPDYTLRQTYEQGLVDVNFQLTEKLTLYGQGGVEFRQFHGGSDETNPIFNAGITYTPTGNATLSLSGYQNVEPSSDETDQTDLNRGVTFTASERVFHRFIFSFTFIYAHTEYTEDGGDNGPVRTTAGPGANFVNVNPNGSSQDNLAYRPSVTFETSQWTTMALYYQYQENTSNSPGGGYHDNQFGLSISAQF